MNSTERRPTSRTHRATRFLCTRTATAACPRLQVGEEDEIEIEFGNLRGDVDVENEAPEISNFAPEHESAFGRFRRGIHLHGNGHPFGFARA